MEVLKTYVIGCVAILALAGLAFHHGWANYDQETVLTYTGEVLELGYENPHGHLTIEGDEKVWLVILAPPSRMNQRGLSPELIAPGTEVTVVGYPHRRIEDEMRAERIIVGELTVELR